MGVFVTDEIEEADDELVLTPDAIDEPLALDNDMLDEMRVEMVEVEVDEVEVFDELDQLIVDESEEMGICLV